MSPMITYNFTDTILEINGHLQTTAFNYGSGKRRLNTVGRIFPVYYTLRSWSFLFD